MELNKVPPTVELIVILPVAVKLLIPVMFKLLSSTNAFDAAAIPGVTPVIELKSIDVPDRLSEAASIFDRTVKFPDIVPPEIFRYLRSASLSVI